MVRVENCGCAEIYLNKGNEETYAEEENLQHNGNHPTGGSDWLTCSIILAIVAGRKGNILTEFGT